MANPVSESERPFIKNRNAAKMFASKLINAADAPGTVESVFRDVAAQLLHLRDSDFTAMVSSEIGRHPD